MTRWTLAALVLVVSPPVFVTPASPAVAAARQGMTPAQYLASFQQTAADLRDSYRSFNAAIGGNILPNTCSLWIRNQANAAQKAKILEIRKLFDRLQDSERSMSDAIRKYALIVMDTKVEGFGVGNCGELSAVVFVTMTKTFPECKFMVVRQIDGDHGFVLARLPNGDIYVIDAWKGTAGGPFDMTVDNLLQIKGTTTAPPQWPVSVQSVTGWE